MLKKYIVVVCMFFSFQARAQEIEGLSAEKICDEIHDRTPGNALVVVDGIGAKKEKAQIILELPKKIRTVGSIFKDDGFKNDDKYNGSFMGITYSIKNYSFGRLLTMLKGVENYTITVGDDGYDVDENGMAVAKSVSYPFSWGINQLCLDTVCKGYVYSESEKKMIFLKDLKKGRWHSPMSGMDSIEIKANDVYGFIFPVESRKLPTLECLP